MAGPVPGMPYIQSAKQNMTKMSCADLRARRDPAIQALQAAFALVTITTIFIMYLWCWHVAISSTLCQQMTQLSDARKCVNE